MSAVTVRDNPAELRYEALRGDQLLGEIRYRTEPGARGAGAHRGHLLGGGHRGRLQARRRSTRRIRSRRLRVVPLCPFVAAYIRRHPEYAALVTQDPAIPE